MDANRLHPSHCEGAIIRTSVRQLRPCGEPDGHSASLMPINRESNALPAPTESATLSFMTQAPKIGGDYNTLSAFFNLNRQSRNGSVGTGRRFLLFGAKALL